MKLPKPKPKRGDINEAHMPKLPYKISPDGYYYLEEKSSTMEVPKAKPKAPVSYTHLTLPTKA